MSLLIGLIPPPLTATLEVSQDVVDHVLIPLRLAFLAKLMPFGFFPLVAFPKLLLESL